MWLWYPGGLAAPLFRDHLVNFSIIYVIWMIVFFVYTLFDLSTFRSLRILFSRFLGAMIVNVVIAISYFYLQPDLILTPRRFLFVHLLVSGVGLALWYLLVQKFLPRLWVRNLYLHGHLYESQLDAEIEKFMETNKTIGWKLLGKFEPTAAVDPKAIVLLPAAANFEPDELKVLFTAKRQGVEFIEYHQFYEQTQRMVHLSGLTEVWFLRSVSYGRRRVYDMFKRGIDILSGLLGTIIFGILLPFLAAIIKLDSSGPVFFVQERVGQNGQIIRLYKLRTMKQGGATNTWTAPADARITRVGKYLRTLRLDELPQLFNIFKGDLSLVGPRPEQVHIVRDLTEQIPYYNERHSVKPGLTGWAQLHVYAATVEETKIKLQYDLYYIKHRSLWFDLEIILRTIFHFITLQGK